ncbi:hypothetical protein ACEWY4_021956 [Coilia grayii]|uniref:Ig-like domain-containing protein n=1 Tax=Coilia grayii TaxID=363190 RepID=A0ABD1J4M7_9TELE
MASIPCVLTVLLMCLSLDYMGVHGNPPTVFSSVGGNATLPCSNVVYPNCSSTNWLKTIFNQTVELVAHGKIKTDVSQHNRLSLASNCSLHIADVTTEDAGDYICQQYLREGGVQHGAEARVCLSVSQGRFHCVICCFQALGFIHHSGVHGNPPTVFSSVGGSATLPCSNVVYPNCSSTTWTKAISNEAVELVAYGKIKTDVSQPNRLSLASNCSLHIADVTTEDAGGYTCQQYLTKGGQQHGAEAQVCLSVSQDVKPTSSSSSSSSKSSSTKTITTTASPSSGQIGTALLCTSLEVSQVIFSVSVYLSLSVFLPTVPAGAVMAGVGVCVGLLAATLITVVVIRKRRASKCMSSLQGEQEAELHYAAFQHHNPTQAGPAAKQPEDTVTYSSIMQLSGGEDQSNSRPVDPSALYATVQKNSKAQN